MTIVAWFMGHHLIKLKYNYKKLAVVQMATSRLICVHHPHGNPP